MDEIQQQFDPSTIQINVSKKVPADERTLGLIRYAVDKGLTVETHAEGTEEDWRKLIDAGVRMFHTSKPSRVKTFLKQLRYEYGWEPHNLP